MLKQFLEKNYPELVNHVHGGNYPPPPFAVYLFQLVQFMQFTGILTLFFADTIFIRILGFPAVPPMVRQLQENQLQVIIFLFVMSSFAQNLLTTGAFEIELNGKLIFSKINTGRMPQIGELARLLVENGVKPIQSTGRFAPGSPGFNGNL